MNKKLKQILNRYPMLEEDRNYIANLANGGSGCNCPIVIDVTELHADRTPVPLSRDIAKTIFDGALVILKDVTANTWYLVNNVTTRDDDFPCDLFLSIPANDNIFAFNYTYSDRYQELRISEEPK